jgi:endoglucanase
MELLKELTQVWGVAGREKKVREIIKREVAPFADEMITDSMGNLIVLKKGTGGGKKIMLAAHMDEIGFQVTKIEPDGRIRLCKVGWVWTTSIYNDKVIFQNGTVGVVGCVGPVEESKNDTSKLFVDIGCTSKAETEKHVLVGDYCGFIGAFHELQNNRICSKSFDNRVGCYMLIKALKRNDGKRVNDIYYVFTVQEEVGCRGAEVTAERIKPDIGLSIDISPDHFYPGDLEGSNAVGQGVGVKFGDPSAMLDETLINEMVSCCQDNNIKYQRDVMDRGGTDSSSINRSHYGVRVAAISIITRYPHSQSSVISTEDIKNGIELVDKYTARTFVFDER